MSPILVLVLLSLCFQMNNAEGDPITPPPDVSTESGAPNETEPTEPPNVTDPDPIPTNVPEVPRPIDTKSEEIFIVPTTIDEGIDSFKLGDKEYLFVKSKIRHRHANLLCGQYQAQLATVKSTQLEMFLAEALSETNLLLDTLWIWGTLENEKWVWKANTNNSEDVSDTIVNDMVYSEEFGKDIAKDCLGFGRSYHDMPQFRPINCGAERSIICERPYVGIVDQANSTHVDWIVVGKREYKIFREHVDYNTARMKCRQFAIGADLAVIANKEAVETLGRYLLIGRPSLENGWTQAKYEGGQFKYSIEENVILSNETDPSTGFPPWRNNTIQKPSGCVLLDRHLGNTSLFVEARCERLRPYICYRKTFQNNTQGNVVDSIIKGYGYRLIYNSLPWQDARDFCKKHYNDYNAKLMETTIDELVHDLTFFMGEYKVAVEHIWIGGKMEKNQWIWDSDENKIDDKIMTSYGIANTSYSESAEKMNLCLNFDRENHNVPMIYGTICSYPQSFICLFDKEKFEELLEKERKEETNR